MKRLSSTPGADRTGSVKTKLDPFSPATASYGTFKAKKEHGTITRHDLRKAIIALISRLERHLPAGSNEIRGASKKALASHHGSAYEHAFQPGANAGKHYKNATRQLHASREILHELHACLNYKQDFSAEDHHALSSLLNKLHEHIGEIYFSIKALTPRETNILEGATRDAHEKSHHFLWDLTYHLKNVAQDISKHHHGSHHDYGVDIHALNAKKIIGQMMEVLESHDADTLASLKPEERQHIGETLRHLMQKLMIHSDYIDQWLGQLEEAGEEDPQIQKMQKEIEAIRLAAYGFMGGELQAAA